MQLSQAVLLDSGLLSMIQFNSIQFNEKIDDIMAPILFYDFIDF